jgi:8-oxo-dGTP pyrophosphatase MutT (NUDIX family)
MPVDRDLRRVLERRLLGTEPATGPDGARFPGIDDEHLPELRKLLPPLLSAAAVLMPIIDRPEGLSLLLTRRASALKRHAGQISFPGGRLEASDAGPLAAALRETEEEIGLSREFVTVAGYLPPQVIITGYWVVPVVGFVQPGFDLALDPAEVEEAFEVPLAHVLDPAQRRQRERQLGKLVLKSTEIPYGHHVIWGATAAMLLALSTLLEQE